MQLFYYFIISFKYGYQYGQTLLFWTMGPNVCDEKWTVWVSVAELPEINPEIVLNLLKGSTNQVMWLSSTNSH